MTISAKIIADSVTEQGKRITTFEIICPRLIWAQILTHRQFSRNCSSSRAQPVKKVIEQIANDPVIPTHFGQNQAGMQAKAEEIKERDEAIRYWVDAKDHAVRFAKGLAKLGVHKQLANRLLEPFSHVKAVITATELDNFFHLRMHDDAQPEIQRLAECMFAALKINSPEELGVGEWHTPYVKHTRTEAGQLIYGDKL